ncbi:MAG: RNA polymerase sigma factor [Phycisphaerales bacterium]
MLNQLTTSFIARLRAQDQGAWFELWETFGPVLRAQLTKWGAGRIGAETVRDLSQETMAALSDSIERYDPGKGARFSTWLLAIAKHVLGDEIDRRSAQKRGGAGAGRGMNNGAGGKGKAKDASFDEAWMTDGGPGGKSAWGVAPDASYEAAMFRAKVEAALRLTEKAAPFEDFEIFRMRVLEGKSGKDVAEAVGTSEPTISRRLAKVRELLRIRLREVMVIYSFTDEEMGEAGRNGLELSPNKRGGQAGGGGAPGGSAAEDAAFDDAVGEIYRRGKE